MDGKGCLFTEDIIHQDSALKDGHVITVYNLCV